MKIGKFKVYVEGRNEWKNSKNEWLNLVITVFLNNLQLFSLPKLQLATENSN